MPVRCKCIETDCVGLQQGSDFFNGWSFFTGNDPTNGAVTYIDQNTAVSPHTFQILYILTSLKQSANLVEINSAGNAVMRVETTPQVASTRQSVRITTESTWNGGLFIMDSVHMPTGCATWPACKLISSTSCLDTFMLTTS